MTNAGYLTGSKDETVIISMNPHSKNTEEFGTVIFDIPPQLVDVSGYLSFKVSKKQLEDLQMAIGKTLNEWSDLHEERFTNDW